MELAKFQQRAARVQKSEQRKQARFTGLEWAYAIALDTEPHIIRLLFKIIDKNNKLKSNSPLKLSLELIKETK